MPSEDTFTEADFLKAWTAWRRVYGAGVNTGSRNALLAGIQAQAQARREGRTIPRPPCPERDAVLARGRQNVAPQQDGATT